MSNNSGITFKTERGVPVVCDNGVLSVQARGDRDTTAVYAYNDNGDIVGKVNVMSYDKVTRKVCLVPVGIDKSEINPNDIKQGLDDKFAKLMVDFEVTVADRIDIEYANGDTFTHGGSGMIGVYNDDQKSAIDKLKETISIDDETCYLFMVKNCIAKKADDSNDVVSGYMPRGYQFGFIYKELNNSRTIAHELSHGAFHLKHTFVADDDYIAPERSTDNLMDYAGGVTLNHWQWQDVHLPKSVRFKWAQDEQDAEWTTDGDDILNWVDKNESTSTRFDGIFAFEIMCAKDKIDPKDAHGKKVPIPIKYLDKEKYADIGTRVDILEDSVETFHKKAKSYAETLKRYLKDTYELESSIIDQGINSKAIIVKIK